jgi:hypothetical protein
MTTILGDLSIQLLARGNLFLMVAISAHDAAGHVPVQFKPGCEASLASAN